MTRAIPPLTDAERVALVAAARSFIGTRWRHQGRNRRGLDCAGLVIVSLRALGFEPVDCVGYGRRAYLNTLEAAVQSNFGPPLPKDTELRAGDVVVMQCSKDGPNHVGIIGDGRLGPTLIHAHAIDRAVMECRLDADWRNRIVEVYR